MTTLDDRVLVVKSEPGAIVRPGDVKVVYNEGMPVRGTGGLTKGKLFIKFELVFPTPQDLADEKKRYVRVCACVCVCVCVCLCIFCIFVLQSRSTHSQSATTVLCEGVVRGGQVYVCKIISAICISPFLLSDSERNCVRFCLRPIRCRCCPRAKRPRRSPHATLS